MKKIFILVFSFVILLCSGTIATNLFASYAEDDQTIKSISSVEEFVATMSDSSTYGNKNVVINIASDLDFNDVDLSSVGSTGGTFMGEFNGNGYTISNITLSSNGQYFGLIPRTKEANIKDIRINGKVEYLFDSANYRELYVGILVGLGENTTFSNCELDNLSEGEEGVIANDITLPIYSSINFGGLAGKIINEYPVGGNVNISNCVSYYNVNATIYKDVNAMIGGLVGQIKNGYFQNNISFGNISLVNNFNEQAQDEISIGGIVGGVYGSQTNIRNSVYGGLVSSQNGINLSLFKGGILGSILSSEVNVNNINFVYFSDQSLRPSGDGRVELGDKVARVVSINREFMSNPDNFDPASVLWDFNKIWTIVNSRYHLQNFQLFEFSFNQVLDKGLVLESARFVIDDEEGVRRLSAKYNQDVNIIINFKEAFYGHYMLTNVILNGNSDILNNEYSKEEILNEKHQVVGYKISLKANAITSGSYSFTIIARGYNCVVTISDQAKQAQEGGILIDNGSSFSFNDIPLTFYSNSRARRIVAEGQDIFVFDHWELFYKDANGNFVENISFDEYQDSGLSILFGQAPFDREFKLVAYFSKNAVNVDFGQYKTNMVRSITLGGKSYQGEPLPVSPTSSQTLIVVLEKDYVLDIDAFTRDIKKLYGDNPTSTLVTTQPEKNEEEGTTTYKFLINMRYINDYDNNSLKLSFMISEDKADNINSLLWLYILLPILAVAIGVIVTIIILKKRRGGSKGDSSDKVKKKKVSYKDYY